MNKKLVMATSFCVGAMMLVTTAFADMASKSGYDQLKDSIKQTSKGANGEIKNFTLGIASSIKHNGKVILSENEIKKFDSVNKMEESTSTSQYAEGNVRKSYYYNDSRQSIYYQPDIDTYNVMEFTDERDVGIMRDSFESDSAKDAEMIFDAVIGNLKDHVMVEEKPDGSKEFSGNLSEVQIPAIVNAVSSFFFKQQLSDQVLGGNSNSKLPNLMKEVAVKNISGKATVDKNGIIENITGAISLSGKDKEGNEHEIIFEVSGGISEIGNTIIVTPDLTGKKVEKSIQKVYDKKIVDQKYAGTYKNNILIEKNNSFVKIGERKLEITHIDDKHVSGSYSEVINPEYTEYSSEIKQFTFDAEIMGRDNAEFNYKNSSGAELKGHLFFDSTGNLYFDIPVKSIHPYNSAYARVFEN